MLRVKWLTRIVTELELDNATVLGGNVLDYPELNETFPVVTAFGVRRTQHAMVLCVPFLVPGGVAVLSVAPTRRDKPRCTSPGHQTYPTELVWSWHTDRGSVTMTITGVEMIEALDMSRPHHGLAQGLLHAFDHPMYYDFNADMELSVKLDGIDETVSGRTLFEKMMFR